MMPKNSEIQIPLLKCLEELGGRARPPEIYAHIKKFFPNLTEADIAEPLPSGGNKWTNRIQWVRQALVISGEMASPAHGVWSITERGRQRLANERSGPSVLGGAAEAPGTPVKAPPGPSVAGPSTSTNLEELADEYFLAFKEKILQKLQDLVPSQFERFSGALLSAFGFNEIKITGKSHDGGLDGHGKLKVGLASMNVAFQCKRWQGRVGRPEIDEFRGAIQGEFEQGIFFTTSGFTSEAQETSIRKGAAPIVLLDGDAIVRLMVEKGLGVQRRPIEIYEDQIEALFEEEEKG